MLTESTYAPEAIAEATDLITATHAAYSEASLCCNCGKTVQVGVYSMQYTDIVDSVATLIEHARTAHAFPFNITRRVTIVEVVMPLRPEGI